MFFRNALNNGLALVESPELAAAINNGDLVTVDLEAGAARIAQKQISFEPLPEYLLNIMKSAGMWGALKNPAAAKINIARSPRSPSPQTLAEKIMSRVAGHAVQQGQFVDITPDWTFALDDGIAASAGYLQQHGAKRVHHADRIALFFDHFSPANTDHHAMLQTIGREFAKQQQIHSLHDIGQGISHQVAVEKGLAKPGQLAVSMDSHNMTLGGVGTMGLAVGNGEMAYIWASGSTWFRVPASIRVTLKGTPQSFVTTKDIILALLRDRGLRWASYKALEFEGEMLTHTSIAERMTLCNMGTELGAKTAIVAPDEAVERHFSALGIQVDIAGLRADAGAVYADEHSIDVATLDPMVACPHTVNNVQTAASLAGTKITQAYLGTCTNGRYEDLAQAAAILQNRHLAPGVRMVVTPASRGAMLRATKDGIIETLLDAGCSIATPGCGACAGVHQGVLGDNDVCISSGSRNYVGRMGSRNASIYLASPATVAASAVSGEICDPRFV
jgi:homoaconitate hydratase family protein